MRWMHNIMSVSGSSLLIAVLLLMLTGCSATKGLKPGEKLYLGADVEVVSEAKIRKKKQLERKLEKMLIPEPNSRFLGIPFRLMIHNMVGEVEKEKGLKYWLKYKLGEPPVLFSQVHPKKTAEMMESRLINDGYFEPEVSHEVIEKGEKKIRVEYTANVNPPYRLRHITFPDDTNAVAGLILQNLDESLLKTGDQFDLNKLIQERKRIDQIMKDNGYYFFSPNYLEFKVDSSVGSRQVDVHLTFKPETPPEAFRVYKLNEIMVCSDYSLEQGRGLPPRDTVDLGFFACAARDSTLRMKILKENIFLREGNIYTRDAHDRTIKRLMALGVFKFAEIEFTEVDSAGPYGLLNAQINLTPMLPKNLRAEIEWTTKSNNFTGPGARVSFRNRNTFRGAELLKIDLRGGFESQVSGNSGPLKAYEYGAEVSLIFPRFITGPIRIQDPSSRFLPKTIFKIGFNTLSRPRYYNMNTYSMGIGYNWKETITKEHELYPINVDYVMLRNQTEEFKDLVEKNLFLRRSVEQQFILGAKYTYTFNDQMKPNRLDHYYFQGDVDISGNLAYLSNRLLKGPQDDPYIIMGQPFAQYARLRTDFRYYHETGPRSKIATRVIVGTGIPYGNSEAMPYVKQFFIGGSSSLRAFPFRSVGPGSYQVPEEQENTFLVEQNGDIKIEMNAEYRFPISGIFFGALFTDMGNIWLMKEDPGRPGGEFEFSSFLGQYAVGTGFGLRIDAQFFVIRADLAWPARKPWLPHGERWVINEWAFGSPKWRGENLILNLGIGYPF